jgi:hypothetical protein
MVALRIRTDVVMENTRTFTAAPGNTTIPWWSRQRRRTAQLFSPFTPTHHHARWHSGAAAAPEPQVRVRHNMPYR